MLLKITILLCFSSMIMAQKYHTLNDDFDEDSAVKNIEILKEQLNCLLDKIPCVPLNQSYKDIMKDAVEHSCGRCLPHIKHSFRVFVAETKKKLPAMYEEFQKKYDPNGKFLSALEAEVSKY